MHPAMPPAAAACQPSCYFTSKLTVCPSSPPSTSAKSVPGCPSRAWLLQLDVCYGNHYLPDSLILAGRTHEHIQHQPPTHAAAGGGQGDAAGPLKVATWRQARLLACVPHDTETPTDECWPNHHVPGMHQYNTGVLTGDMPLNANMCQICVRCGKHAHPTCKGGCNASMHDCLQRQRHQ